MNTEDVQKLKSEYTVKFDALAAELTRELGDSGVCIDSIELDSIQHFNLRQTYFTVITLSI